MTGGGQRLCRCGRVRNSLGSVAGGILSAVMKWVLFPAPPPAFLTPSEVCSTRSRVKMEIEKKKERQGEEKSRGKWHNVKGTVSVEGEETGATGGQFLERGGVPDLVLGWRISDCLVDMGKGS